MKKLLLPIFLCAASICLAQNSHKGVDAEIRENPNLGAVDSTKLNNAYSKYPFLHLDANNIQLNGADWTALRQAVAATDTAVLTIVHLGDSHIQAEGSTTPTRLMLQKRYGTGGRGLIIPFKIAGTNQPWDYTFTTTSEYTTSKLLKKPWVTRMGFTGISLQPHGENFNLHVSAAEKEGIDTRFNKLRIHFTGTTPEVASVAAHQTDLTFTPSGSLPGVLEISLDSLADEATITFSALPADAHNIVNIHGIELLNTTTNGGIVYSAIGNNGATYGTYNGVDNEARGLASLNPELIIISLGANESFGKISDEDFYKEINHLVGDIRRECPDAALLLTTPNETHKSYTKTATTRRKGRRRGKSARKVKSYHVNADSKRLRDVILLYGKENNVPTYDWFEVAGGEGSSHPWLETGLMRNDRIHNSWEGYNLQGKLMYDALIEKFNK